AWQLAKEQRRPVLSHGDMYFGEPSVIVVAPAVSSYVEHQDPSLGGYVLLVLPLDELFKEFTDALEDVSETLYVLDNQGLFLYHNDPQFILNDRLHSLTSDVPLDNIEAAMKDQRSGFAVYKNHKRSNYLSFSPVVHAGWSLAMGGDYSEIRSEISRISYSNIIVIAVGLLLGLLLLYIVVHRVDRHIEILRETEERISRGDNKPFPQIQSSSEIGLLSKWMGSMVNQLRDQHKNLEIIVEERTTELVRTNEELEQTVDELNHSNDTLLHTRENLEIRVEERTQELKNSHLYIRNIIDSIPSLIIAIDTGGRITQVNFEAEKYFGHAEKRVIGESFTQYIPYLQDYKDEILGHIAQEQTWESVKYEVEIGNKKNYLDIGIFPLVTHEVIGGVIRLDDITKEVVLEDSLRQSQKLEGIGQIAGGVAHDFNNMLAGILGGAELLQNHVAHDQEAQEYISMILDSADHAAVLTRKLLSFSHRGVRSSEKIDINHTIDGAMSLLERSLDKSIELLKYQDSENLIILADPTENFNLLLNLGINAAQAMMQGGTLSFKTFMVELDGDYCLNSTFNIIPGKYVEIRVKDTGTGIKKEIQKQIFEPFFTTKDKGGGTGLGLAAVYATVLRYKGEILLISEENIGSEFIIHFPMTFKENEESEVLTDITYEHHQGCILVVDDERVIRASTKSMLEDLGYDVLLAEDGRRGLEIFKENQETIVLVILDMIMPVMNGTQCFKAIKEISPETPIFMASGFAKEEDIKELLSQGLFGFLQKPYKMNDLSSMVSRAIDKSNNS
ncbi:MAG: response regulator, partial [Spirochaetaceae bacterium]|nr:response regulator [Spirochaetaceae bacterium]